MLKPQKGSSSNFAPIVKRIKQLYSPFYFMGHRSFLRSNTFSKVSGLGLFFTFSTLYRWYQIAQRITFINWNNILSLKILFEYNFST